MRILGLKNTITEIKNSTDRLDSRLDIAKERINHLEDKSVENISPETEREKKWKTHERAGETLET